MNIDELLSYNPVLLALFATLFTWGVTALGAAMVFFFKSINKNLQGDENLIKKSYLPLLWRLKSPRSG